MNTEKPIGHAPGVLCLIRGIPSGYHNSGDNGKVVTLVSPLFAGMQYVCKGCGKAARVNSAWAPVWVVSGKGLECWRLGEVMTETAVPQRNLFPLGDRSLLSSDELTMEQQHIIDAFDKALPDRLTVEDL